MRIAVFLVLIVLVLSCENRALHDSEEFKPREIHENIEFHFDRIEVDGVEYLILEKDNNNPHEGFGFMAFRANKLVEKQDTTLAYMKSILEMQQLIYSRVFNVSQEAAEKIGQGQTEPANGAYCQHISTAKKISGAFHGQLLQLGV